MNKNEQKTSFLSVLDQYLLFEILLYLFPIELQQFGSCNRRFHSLINVLFNENIGNDTTLLLEFEKKYFAQLQSQFKRIESSREFYRLWNDSITNVQ